MWFLLPTVFLGVAEGSQGRNFMIALEDRDQILAEDPPSLWVIPTGGVSVEYPLRDMGDAGDAEAGDHSYSTVVDDLPVAQVLLVLQNSQQELWRQADFLVPVEMDYPALRFQLENGKVEGGLQDNPSPEERREQEAGLYGPDGQLIAEHRGTWRQRLVLGFLFLGLVGFVSWAVALWMKSRRLQTLRKRCCVFPVGVVYVAGGKW